LADILAVRSGLADAIRTGTGVRTYAGNRDQVETPCYVVPLPEVEYHTEFGNGIRCTFGVRYLVARADEVVAEERLAEAMSPSTLLAAAEADQTLDGTAETVAVTNASRMGVYAYGDIDYLGVEFTIDVLSD